MSNNSSYKFALGSIEACFESETDTTFDWWLRNIYFYRASLQQLFQFLLIVLLIDLKDLCATEENISFLVALMELFLSISR
jgi:hypothetical protein